MAKNNLLAKLKKASTIAETDVLADTKFFQFERIVTEIPALNVAFNGELNGGLSAGVTMLAGESRSFKTGFMIQLAKAFQNQHDDGVIIFYDSEFSNIEYWVDAGIDISRVLHSPITTVEQLKIDMSTQLDELTVEDNVWFLTDSIGGLASKKEAEDAVDGKSTVDMTRAKALNSLLRIVTPQLKLKNIPWVLINSFYETMEMYPKRVYAGGKKVFLSCDDVWFIRRKQEKKGNDKIGWVFTLVSDKSRDIVEGSTFPIVITYEGGINKRSGLYDWAKEAGMISVAGAWIKLVDFDTGGVYEDKNFRVDDIPDVWYDRLLADDKFNEFIKCKFKLNYNNKSK